MLRSIHPNVNLSWSVSIFTHRDGRVLGTELNCRIPCHLFASDWIRIATIVIYLVLQSTPTHVCNWGGHGVAGYSAVPNFHIYQFSRPDKGKVDVYGFLSKHSSDHYVLFCHNPLSHLVIDASCMKLMHTRIDFKLHSTIWHYFEK